MGSTVVSTIQSNTIAGITVTNSYNGTTAVFAGINVAAGIVNIGGSLATGNKIGTSSNSIFITTTGITSNSYGIFSNQSTGSSQTISFNNIVNCTIYSSVAASATTKFAAIYIAGTSGYSVSDNNINAAISTSEYLFYGIEANLGTTVTSNINNNTIAGVTMTSTYEGTVALFAGIYIRAGIVNIGSGVGNIIGTGSNSIFLTTSGTTSNSYGIFSDQTVLAPTISNNIIQNILLQSNVAAGSKIKFSGIYLTGGSGNFVNTNTIGNRINATNYVVNGIELNLTGTITNSIQGNTIAGIDITTNLSGTIGTEESPFVGINVVTGLANIGNTIGNFIGTSAEYIRINTSGNRTHNYGIKIGITVASITIANNSLENIALTSTAVSSADWMNVFTGIYANNNGAYTISDNSVGSKTISNSISLGTSNTAVPFVFKGIVVECAYGVTIARNTISNISNASSNNGVLVNAQIIGIFLNTPTTNVFSHSIDKNKIYNLNATNTNNVNVNVAGIVTGSTATAGTISNNTIYGFTNTAIGTTNSMSALIPNGGNLTVSNNMFSLSNGTNTNGVIIKGIFDLGAAGTRNYYFNSIHIEGTSTSTHNSVAFQFDRVTGTLNSRNNIFDMRRTGAGKNYAIVNASGNFTSYVSDYNVINAPNASAVCYTNSDKTFAAWKTLSAMDAKSIYDEPVPFVNQSIADLHIVGKPCKLIGQGIAISITTDFDTDTRKAGVRPFGPDMGADEVGKNITWTGTVNSNWNNIANWGGAPVPNSVSDNVIIPNVANKPIINAGESFQVSSITIASGSSLINNGTLKVFQSIFATNTLNTQNGNIEFNGQCIFQSIAGSMFTNRSIKSLIISNASGSNPSVVVSNILNDTLKITENLSFGNVNNTFLKTGDNLTLVSNAAATASLADLTNGGANTGNVVDGKVNVERYMFARSAWRLLATPIQIATSPTVSQAWRENNSAHTATGYGTRITGPVGPFGAAGILDDYTVNPSMKSYNALTNNFTGITNANTTPIANTKGYYVFVRGDRSGAPVIGLSGISTLRMKGDLRQGDQVFTIPAGKFESIGNPFASRIDMRSVNKSNVVNAFYIWNPNNIGLYNVGGYEAYVFNISTGNYERIGDGLVRNYIESGEAFFVQSNVASPAGTFTIKETDKGNGSANVSRPGVTTPTLEINLFAQNMDGISYVADGVKLNYNNSFNAGIDNMDVRKINNTYDNLSIKNGVSNLIVERRPHIIDTDTIKLNITGMRLAPYRLEIDPSVLTNPNIEGTFVDKYLQTRTPISFTDITAISFEITADAASKAADRFMIVFKAVPSISFKNIAAVRTEDKVVKINWIVDNEVGVENYTIEHSTDGVNFTAIGTETAINNNGAAASYNKIHSNASTEKNWYRVKVNITLGAPKYSAIALVNEVLKNTVIAKAKITIVQKGNSDKEVAVLLNNYTKGKYVLVITNTVGQIIKQSQVNVDSDTFMYDLKTNPVAKGNYQLTIINSAGQKSSIAYLVM